MEWEYSIIGLPVDMPPEVLEQTNPVIISGAIVKGTIPTVQYLSQLIAGGVEGMPDAQPISHDLVRIGSTLVLTILIRHRKPEGP